jgi:hypothetical protein
MKNLSEKINGILEGDLLAFSNSDSFKGAGYLVEFVTPKAILVDGNWIPKSQIIDVELGVKFNGGIECKDICLNSWFDDQLCKDMHKKAKWAF